MHSLILCRFGKRSKDRSQSEKTLSEGEISGREVLDEQESEAVVVGSKGLFDLGRDVLVGDQVLVVDDDGFVLERQINEKCPGERGERDEQKRNVSLRVFCVCQ